MSGYFYLEKHIGSKSVRFYNEKHIGSKSVRLYYEKHIGSKSGRFYSSININKIIKWHPEKKGIGNSPSRHKRASRKKGNGNSHFRHNRASKKKELATVISGIIEHPVNCGGAKGQRRRILVSIRITGHAPMSI